MQAKAGGFSVLSVPVSPCDRRALSEAWFSALHLHPAAKAERAIAVSRCHEPGAQRLRTLGTATVPSNPNVARRALGAALVARPGFPGEGLSGQKKAPRLGLAQRIERTFFERRNPPRQASFVLEDGKARVHVVVRTSGLTTRIVALCASVSRSIVALALAEARTSLTVRGLRVRADLREVAPQ